MVTSQEILAASETKSQEMDFSPVPLYLVQPYWIPGLGKTIDFGFLDYRKYKGRQFLLF